MNWRCRGALGSKVTRLDRNHFFIDLYTTVSSPRRNNLAKLEAVLLCIA